MNQENFNPLYEWAEKTRTEFAVAYDLEGLKKIEAAIAATRDDFQSLTENEKYLRVHSLGAFLGQCMVANLGGEWHQTGDGIGIKLEKQGIWVDPFLKVWNQFEHESATDAISSFYERSRDFVMIGSTD